MIPKVIHYCWLSNDPFPAKIQYCIDSWKKKLPDYEFVCWNYEKFPRGTSKWVDQAFDNHKYAFAADYIRLYALYNCGGIYLDSDVEALQSFDRFLDFPYFICWEKGHEDLSIEMAALGCEKGSEWIGLCLEQYRDRDFVNPDGSFNDTPLPKYVHSLLRDNGYSFNTVNEIKQYSEACKKDARKLAILPSYYFSPKSYETGVLKIEKDTICIHHFAGSWLPKSYRLKMQIKYLLGERIVSFVVQLKRFFSFRNKEA